MLMIRSVIFSAPGPHRKRAVGAMSLGVGKAMGKGQHPRDGKLLAHRVGVEA
jgi:hypothetical protein